MKPQFTTPCYVQIDDNSKFKEVTKKLYSLGYLLGQAHIDALDNAIITFPEISNTFCTGTDGQFDDIDTKGRIDCGTNEALFLDLAAMRSDTIIGQWVIYGNEMYRVTGKEGDCYCYCYNIDYYHFAKWYELERATATEIIEWHKKKGE